MKKHSKILLITAVLLASTLLTFCPEAGGTAALRPSEFDACFLWWAFTCHLVHWSAEHWLYDIACFVIIAWRLPIQKSLPCLILSSIAISIAVTMAYPWMTAYGGLSGVNCALYTAWAFHIMKRSKTIGCLALVTIVAKTILEIHAGHTFFVDNIFIPADMAHVTGIISGIICGICGNRLSKEIDIAHNEGKFQWS
ncbi:MAG: hypothetical protein IKP58_19320 [Victivallales bacterium]|nr:hypothetical protein [Victivallales bacterium]